MPELERTVSRLADQAVHNSFRLFLTSKPCGFFPVSILQTATKITNEPPKGLIPNILKSLNNIEAENLLECEKPEIFKRMLFGLCFFHSVAQERQKYGSIGWNVRYMFNDSDLDSSITMLRTFLNTEEETIPWDAIRHMIGNVNYGGRVTEEMDLRLLMNLLGIYINPQIFEPNYKFSQLGIYHVPENNTIEGYITYLNSLPMIEAPEIFGLGDNSNIKLQKGESDNILKTALLMQPRD